MGTLTNPNRALKLNQLKYFESKLAGKYQTQDITAIQGLTATTVEGALAELLGKVGGSEITWEVLATPNTGKSKTIRIYKAAGTAAETHIDIDFEKEEVRAIVGFVTITAGTGDDAGKFFDGATEVGAADGVTSAGIYLKSQELKDGVATGVNKYVDASAVIEYLTVGAQTGAAIVLSIDPVTHEISASIADASIAKGKLAQGVQDSLDAADSAYQKPSGGIPDTDMSSDVQTSLGKADSAVQSVAEGATNGTVAVDGTDVAVHGLGSAAYQPSSAFEPAITYATDSDIDEIFAEDTPEQAGE